MPPALLHENDDGARPDETGSAAAPDAPAEPAPEVSSQPPAVVSETASPPPAAAEEAAAAGCSSADSCLCPVCVDEPEPAFGRRICGGPSSGEDKRASASASAKVSPAPASKKKSVLVDRKSPTSFSGGEQPSDARHRGGSSSNDSHLEDVFCQRVGKVCEKLRKHPMLRYKLPDFKPSISLPASLCVCVLCEQSIDKYYELFVYEECLHAYHFTCCLQLSDMNATCEKCLHPTVSDQNRKQYMMWAAFRNGQDYHFKNVKPLKK